MIGKAVLWLLAANLCVHGYVHDVVPLSKRELQARVLMARQTFACGPGQKTELAGATFLVGNNSNVDVYGLDRAGKSWTFAVHSRTCTVWRKDLDGNGTEDLVFLDYDTSSSSTLVIVLFDAQQRPVPWVMGGPFESDKDGVLDILDTNADGHAEVIVMGHRNSTWITDLYEAKNGALHSVRGEFGTRSWPVRTAIGRKKDVEGDDTFVPDYSNAFSEPLPFVKYLKKTKSGCVPLVLPEAEDNPDLVSPCKEWLIRGANAPPCPLSAVVIVDDRDGRRIAGRALLRTLQPGKNATVRVAGQLSSGHSCDPVYTWVTNP